MNQNSETALLEAIRQATGLGQPGNSQFDDLTLIENCGERFVFNYSFDFDGFSQYDETLQFCGEARVVNGRIEIVRLELTHVGVATDYDKSHLDKFRVPY